MWENYWKEKEQSVFDIMNHTADSIGFTTSAFDGFKKWVSSTNEMADESTESITATAMGLDDLIDKTDEKVTYISSLQFPSENLALVKSELNQLEGVKIFDPSGRLLLMSIEKNIDISALPDGLYLVVIETPTKQITSRILKSAE